MRVALLGTGAMGSRMARRYRQAGHEVVVYNRSAERARVLEADGLSVAATAREAAAVAEVVVSMVSDDHASRQIWLDPDIGAVAGLRPGVVAVESSTVTLAWVQELADASRGRQASFLDAPVVGSRPQADAGALVQLVGGDAGVLARVQGLLASAAGAVHHLGDIGSGMAMKLAVNSLFAVQVAALAESLAVLERNGIARARATEILTTLPVTSPSLKGAAAQMTERSFSPLFPVHLVEKDLRCQLDASERARSVTPMAAAVREVFERAKRAGYGDLNISGVAALYD